MWDTEMVKLLRGMILDKAEPYKYADEDLRELILVSAQLIQTEVQFAQVYQVDVDDEVLTPDPTEVTETTVRDDSFINLVTLKSACILDNGSARLAVEDIGPDISDMGFSVRQNAALIQAKLQLLRQGWCAVYNDAKFEFKFNRYTAAGAIIVSMIRSPDRSYYFTGRYR
jgi:hypothetical protein